MDKAFDKLGLYDFMGIWGPGVIFCVYFSFTFNNITASIFERLSINETVECILIYVGVAYFIGVVLHEVGKKFADTFPYFFDFRRYSRLETLKLKKKNKCFFTPRSLQYRYVQILTECKALPTVSFDEAYSLIKFTKDIDCRRVNVYHSVYGLSRGITVGLFFHLILTVIDCIYLRKLNYLVFVDSVLIYIFFCRTVRYFINWIMNVYLQYHIIKEEKLKLK